MKFQIIENPTCKTSVTVNVPAADGVVEQSISVTFNVLSMSALQAFEPLDTHERQNAFLDATVLTFDDVVDDKQKPVVVTPAIRRQLLDMPFIRNAILRDYTLLMAGAKTKN